MWREISCAVLDRFAPRRCPGCDYDLEAKPAGALCGACAPLLERAASGQGVFLHQGPLADAIYRLKYRGRHELGGPLGRLLTEMRPPLAGLTVIVPVPLHPRRLRARGYNQSALLAAVLARGLGLPVAHGALRRVRDTPPQVGLSREARAHNVQGAFSAAARVRDADCLLVDDVCTSGATLLEAGRALREAGACSAQGIALSQAEPGADC